MAAALHILFRFLDFDQYSAGIDAENELQFQRAQAAVSGGGGGVPNLTSSNNSNVNYSGQYNNAGTTYVNRGPDGTTTTTTTAAGPKTEVSHHHA